MAWAQEAEDEILDEVVVTGTRVADRTRLDTLSPVDVLTVAALESQGSTELATALARLAPSVNFPRPSLTDGTDSVRPAALRGLSPDQTLVLVNSKRRHATALVNTNGSVGRGSAAVDLNALPLSAIDRLEVLRDGASAQYGSDAIAGVVNVRLREARDGGGVTLSYGQYDTSIKGVLEEDRRTAKDGKTTSLSAWTGLPLGAEGFLTLSGEFRDRDSTSRGGIDNRPASGTPRVTSRFGDPNSKDTTLYANAGLPLASGWELYGWAGFQDREADSAAGFRQAGSATQNVPSIYPDGFLPLIVSDAKDYTASGGTRGRIGEWDADFSLVFGRNRIDYGVENSVNASWGTTSPTEFDAGAFAYDQLVLNAGFTRRLELGLSQPVNFAWGLEARREGFEIVAGELASYAPPPEPVAGVPAGAQTTSQGFAGVTPGDEVDEDRTAFALYADLETNLTDKLLASVAARAERYSDFGTTATGKLALRYDFTPAFALRGTVSRGFRAPSLQQQHYAFTQLVFLTPGSDPVETRTVPATSQLARDLGAGDLRAEKSWNYTVGAVVRAGGFEATVDAYQIDIDDRILLSENLNEANTPGVGAILEPYNVSAARFFINAFETRTRGIDVVLRKPFVTAGAGRFEFTAAANFSDNDTQSLSSSTGVLPSVTLLGRQNLLRLERGSPQDKYVLGAEWNRNFGGYRLGADLRTTRYGETLNAAGTTAGDVVLEPAWITDLSVNARVKLVTLTAGVDNLFDKYPTRPTLAQAYAGAGGTGSGVGIFSSFSPFGYNGRFLYGKVSINW